MIVAKTYKLFDTGGELACNLPSGRVFAAEIVTAATISRGQVIPLGGGYDQSSGVRAIAVFLYAEIDSETEFGRKHLCAYVPATDAPAGENGQT